MGVNQLISIEVNKINTNEFCDSKCISNCCQQCKPIDYSLINMRHIYDGMMMYAIED